MPKEVTIPEQTPQEVAVVTADNSCHCNHAAQNRMLIIAVAATLVLFVIGLILGYLLGRSSVIYRGSSMMDNHRRAMDQGRMQLRSGSVTNPGSTAISIQ